MSNNTIQAYAAMQAGEKLVPYQFDAGELQPHQVEVKVEYCGLCHSDISVLNNEWRSTVYPVVAGHEIIGRIVALGSEAKRTTNWATCRYWLDRRKLPSL